MLRAVLIVFGIWMSTSTCFASVPVSDPSTEVEEPNLSSLQLQILQKGTKSPWTGVLIAQDDLVRWRFRIEELEFELRKVRKLHTSILQVETELTKRKLEIERERARLIQELWKSQSEKLGEELRKTQTHLLEAQKVKWWEHPVLWFAVGVVITSGAGLVVISLSGT